MRALYLRTTTPSNENVLASFLSLFPDTQIMFTDNPDVDLVEAAEAMRPDLIVYVGAIDAGTHRKIPHLDELVALGQVAPMIHLCFDASDWAWHPFLESYHDSGAFALQVAIDGSYESPIARWRTGGMIWITPIDYTVYKPKPWSARDINCGFAGGWATGHPQRAALIEGLLASHLATRLDGYPTVPYAELAAFYCRCKSVPNSPVTGSGKRYHVKGRVIECALAGAVLIEARDSPTARWFTPKKEYLEFGDTREAASLVLWVMNNAAKAAAMAQRMHDRAMDHYKPVDFWSRVLAKAGVAP